MEERWAFLGLNKKKAPATAARANSQSGGDSLSALLWAGVIVQRQRSVDLFLCAKCLLVEVKTLVEAGEANEKDPAIPLHSHTPRNDRGHSTLWTFEPNPQS